MFAEHRPGNLVSQVGKVPGDEIGHFTIFRVPPGLLNDIEFGGVCREELYVNLMAIDIPQQTGGFFVPAEAVSNEQQRSFEMAPQLLHKRKEVVPGEILGAHGEIKPDALLHRGNGDGPGDGEPIMAVPAVMHRRVPSRRPGPAHRWLQHKASFINEDEGTALTPGFFLAVANLRSATWR
jgi:hypothetical protein